MTSMKCASCGLVLWATAENCKRCGAPVNPQADSGQPSQASTGFAETRAPRQPPGKIRNGSARRWALAAIAALAVLALPVTWLVVQALNSGQAAQEMVLRNGNKVVARPWFHSWFARDPSADQIFDHYLKASGWQDHSQELNSYIANGAFEIKNDAAQTIARSKEGPYRDAYAHVHWTTCAGNVELKGMGPDKLLITQQYYPCGSARTWQRGTNGGTAWSRKDWHPQDPQESSEPEKAKVADLYSGLADLKRGAEFVNYLQLQTRRAGLLLNGKSMVGDRVCYEVQSKSGSSPTNMTYGSGAAEIMYFDVETGLLLKFEHYRPEFPYLPFLDEYELARNVPSHLAETYLEDYREINGVQIPFVARQHLDDLWITMTISEFKGNPEITSPEFDKPTK